MKDASNSGGEVEEGERVRAVELQRLRVGDGTELAWLAGVGAVHLLPSTALALLERCQRFDSLEAHARRCIDELKPTGETQESVQRTLQRLAEAGFLVSRRDFIVASARSPGAEGGGVRLGAVGVVTHERPDGVIRCVKSFADNARRHGRRVEFVVSDDSRSADAQRACRERLRGLQRELDLRISYAGREERTAFARALCQEGAAPTDIVDFALFGGGGQFTPGANRNALLLQFMGGAFLTADDDVVCEAFAVPERHSGLSVTSGPAGSHPRFYADRDAARQAAVPMDVDFLSGHERLLGREVGACLAAAAPGTLDLDGMSPATMGALSSRGGRVVLTQAGYLGDNGWWTIPLARVALSDLEALSTTTPERVLGREVIRTTPNPTLFDAPYYVAGAAAHDLRIAPPPFLPNGRGEDALFPVTLRLCFPDLYLGFVPLAVLHAPFRVRRFEKEDLWEHSTVLTPAEVISGCLMSTPASLAAASPEDRQRALARHLVGLGGLRPAEFKEFLRPLLWSLFAPVLEGLEALLGQSGQVPPVWRDPLRKARDGLSRALLSEDFPRLRVYRPGEPESLVQLQRQLSEFGRLLDAWPDIAEASIQLRASGTPLAVPV